MWVPEVIRPGGREKVGAGPGVSLRRPQMLGGSGKYEIDSRSSPPEAVPQHVGSQQACCYSFNSLLWSPLPSNEAVVAVCEGRQAALEFSCLRLCSRHSCAWNGFPVYLNPPYRYTALSSHFFHGSFPE